MPAIYMVRHGQTIWNRERRFQGAQDSPLTELGRAQAAAVGAALASELEKDGVAAPAPAAVSPLGRTRETATIIAERVALDLRVDPLLREQGFGDWEGLPLDAVIARLPQDAIAGGIGVWGEHAPSGERFADALARARSFLEAAERPLVVVSHGMLGRMMRGAYLGLDWAAMNALPIPQDAFFVLEDGVERRVEASLAL